MLFSIEENSRSSIEGHYMLFSIEEGRTELFDCSVANVMSKVTHMLVCIVLAPCFCFASSVCFGSFKCHHDQIFTS